MPVLFAVLQIGGFFLKRKLFVVLALVFLLSLISVTAFADAVYSYKGKTTSDGMFSMFYCDGVSPGLYNMWVVDDYDGEKVAWTTSPVDLSFSGDSYSFGATYAIVDSVSYGSRLLVGFEVYKNSPEFFTIGFDFDESFVNAGGGVFGDGYTLYLEPVLNESASDISALVTSDMLSGSLDQIVKLLPIVLIVVICCIGLRKGISFLLDVLRRA